MPLPTIRYQHTRRTAAESLAEATGFCERMRSRRSVRNFSSEPIPLAAVEKAIEAANSAPSGANKQPWTFVLVTDEDLKRQIRVAAEQEEEAFYSGGAPTRWLADLEPLGTNAHKPYLALVPALIVVFAQKHGSQENERHYYVAESVGIAVGFLLAALHHAGFATLTHTPSPMDFLRRILRRPENERAFCVIPVGYPTADCQVPDIAKKTLEEVLVRM
ncbi:MAG: nitroreductase family protein [Polyangiaceae bacterium]|nr:nitroreductase family protein [Polyangiaceae bacterium]